MNEYLKHEIMSRIKLGVQTPKDVCAYWIFIATTEEIKNAYKHLGK